MVGQEFGIILQRLAPVADANGALWQAQGLWRRESSTIYMRQLQHSNREDTI